MLGVSPAADAFKAALRIPNLMQNLLGGAVGVVHPRVRPAAGGAATTRPAGWPAPSPAC